MASAKNRALMGQLKGKPTQGQANNAQAAAHYKTLSYADKVKYHKQYGQPYPSPGPTRSYGRTYK